jgi:class 3 adenylate cyclase/tetratricopeptide (TPR) repeat protein
LQRYIPKELLKKLNAAIAGGGLVGERRVVTMLFCDVKGSTAAAEQLDPEDWTDVINGAFENMIKPVYKYEGTVARLMGDSILAFFGAPIAHEDDPARAVLAGLEIVAGIKPYCEKVEQRFGVAVDVRVGINTGMVVVGAVGSDLRLEYTAMGDAINLAARMEQTAEPGTVQIAHDTYKLVAPLFDVEELGGISVKGKEEPILAYRVIARKAEPGRMRGLAGLESRLIGRAIEMATLDEILGNAQHGVGHIVCLMSEAGLGKTRLIEEIRNKWKHNPELDWYSISSLSYESSNAYGIFQNLVRQLLGIGYDDSPADSRHKLEPMLDWFDAAHRGHADQVLSVLLGIEDRSGLPPLEGEAFRRELHAVIEHIFRKTLSAKPGVLVIDDLHWSDAASIELLIALLPLTNELPLVLLFALRPNRDAPGWQVTQYAERELSHRYTELKLRPLSAQDSRLMVQTLLGGVEIPEEMMTKILERAVGNPFFIEEVVRSLIENGTFVRDDSSGRWTVTARSDMFDIPDSLHALLAARIDQLEEMTRRTLQLSAVIGRSFYARVLAAIAEPGHDLDRELGTLQRLEMIGEAARMPEIEYRFRNPLTQEVVYKTILVKQRREFHRRVAETMEALYPDRLDEYSGLLAHHFVASDLYGKAVEYLRRAARRAQALYSYDDATRHLHAALDLMPANTTTGTLRAELVEELADVRRGVRDFTQAIALYRQALDLYRAASDYEPVQLVRVHRKLIQIATDAKWSVDAATYRQIGEVRKQSLPLLESSLRELEGKAPHAESVFLSAALSMDAWRNQDPPDWESAQRFAQSGVDMAEQLDDPVLLSQALGALASVLDGRSLLREHLAVALRRFEISNAVHLDGRERFDVRERIDALRGVGVGLMYVGEYEQALPHLEEAEALAARTQTIDQQANAIGIQAQCYLRADRWDEVLKLEDKWRDLERRYSRERVGETCFFVALSGTVHALRGDREQAEKYRLESFDYMVSMSGPPEQWQRNQFY